MSIYKDQYRPRYDGPEYVPERDHARMKGQTLRVYEVMKDGLWHTVEEISAITGDPQASVSAQLRHLRKPRFGGHIVNRRSRKGQLFEFQLENDR